MDLYLRRMSPETNRLSDQHKIFRKTWKPHLSGAFDAHTPMDELLCNPVLQSVFVREIFK